MSGAPDTPAEKLAALSERIKGTAILSLLNLKQRPSAEVLAERVSDLRGVVHGLCAHLAPDDPIRVSALERLKDVEALLHDPVEWHILARAEELQQDPTDPRIRASLEGAFFEEHLPRTVWQSVPHDGTHAELRKNLRVPMLLDVELDVEGKPVRCRMQNLSRDGVCLEVPAGFAAKKVAFEVLMPATNARIALAGDVIWSDVGRVGVAFKIEVAAQTALDAALRAHFAGLEGIVARWRQTAPTSDAALACAAIVGYAAGALPSERRLHLDSLVTAVHDKPGSKELQLALAKLRIEESDYVGAEQALKRVVVADRADPRFRLLELTLAKRRGAGGGPLRERLRHTIAAGRGPLAAVLMLALIGASVFAFVSLRGPLSAAPVPVGGLACQRVDLLDENALCTMEASAYKRLPPAERARLANTTIQALRPRGVRQVTVIGTTPEEGVLDAFDTYTTVPAR